MGCCSGEANKVGIAEIKRSRLPTDCLWFASWVFGWVVVVMVYQQAVAAGGNPDKLTKGTDMWGQICGVDTNNSFAAWPHPSHDYYNAMICVSSCNETNSLANQHMAVIYPSTAFLGFCIPDPLSSANATGPSITIDTGSGNSFAEAQEMLARAIGDIGVTRDIILSSAGACIIVVFIWIFLLKFVAGLVVWACVFGIAFGVGFGAFQLNQYALDVKASGVDPDRAKAAEYASYVVAGLGAIYVIVIFFLRKQIKIAVEVVKESAKAMLDMKFIVLFPFVPFVLGVVYFMFWIFTGLHIWAVGELVPTPTPEEVYTYNAITHTAYLTAKQLTTNPLGTVNMTNENPPTMLVMQRSKEWQYMSVFHFFHALWNVQFLVYLGYLTFAGATADWYFTSAKTESGKRKRGSGEGELTNWPVLASFKRTVLYHLGTVAICSLIIAIVQLMRAAVKYLEKQASGNPPNKLQKALFAAIQVCLKCLECCLDKLNRNALIWTAIWGDGFCTAACSAFELLWRNLHRVAAINVVSTILIFLSKIAVCAMTTAIYVYLLTAGGLGKDISSPVAPSMLIFAISYMVGSLFLTVFLAIIDAVFLCFLVDLETNGHGRMVASKSLQQLVGKYAKESQESGDKEVARHDKRTSNGNDVTRIHIANKSDRDTR